MISNYSKQDIIKMSTITSIYIPRMSSAHDEDCVIREFEEIGKVSRVDFVPINKKPGFVEPEESFIRSAFVHFDYYYNNEKSIKIMEKLCQGSSYKMDVLITTNPSLYMPHIYEYWLLLKATNPVQKTMMNTHQIVDNCRFLESSVDEQAKTIDEQAKTIEKLVKKVEGIHEVVYQMVANVFHGKKQNICVKILFDDKYVYEDSEDNASVATMSTHSSMPELVDIPEADNDDNSWSESVKSVEHRIKISNELCGNK